jgi:signal transduction histidine kinase
VSAPDCPLAAALAARLRDSRMELTARWLERIADRVALDPQRIFPTDDLLDHMPLLVVGIANFIEQPEDVILADSGVVFRARELGALRHGQGFSEYEILKEFELLGSILFAFLTRATDEIDMPCSRAEIFSCAQRLFRAVVLIQQATTIRFLELAKARVSEREERLRAFQRALTHEMRNRIGATLGAGQLLQIDGIPAAQRGALAGVVVRNASSMRLVLENLLELSRVDPNSRHERRVSLRAAVVEVARQLRDAAAGAGVEVRVSSDLPNVETNAAAVELCLTNLLSNAIKYADQSKPQRWVEISARAELMPDGTPVEVVIEVRDNGRGVPGAARARLFDRFFRAHESVLPEVEGTGLGLSLVRDVVESLNGRAWVEHPDEGVVFGFALPCRRMADAALLVDHATGPGAPAVSP